MHENFSQLNPGSVRPTKIEPVDYSLSKPPSIILYFSLIITVVILISLSFHLNSQNWASFFLNLSTEIAGAVIILVFVERRISGIFPGFYLSQVKAYVKVLAANLKVNRMVLYMSRPQVEMELKKLSDKGFVFIGTRGSGKTVLLQNLVRSLADDFLRDPQAKKVPVLVPFHELTEGDPTVVLRTNMQHYFPMRNYTFNRLLKKQRLICIFDGLEDLLVGNDVITGLQTFHKRYPLIPLIISTRPLENDPLAVLELPLYPIPPFSDTERDKLKRIEERMK